MFFLETLPDISKWNIININKDNLNDYKTILDYNFNVKLNDADISEILKNNSFFLNINTKNIYQEEFSSPIPEVEQNTMKKEDLIDDIINKIIFSLDSLFNGCQSLKHLPDISRWNIENVKNIQNMFYGCISLIDLPDISKWNTNNIKNIVVYFLIVLL